MSTVNTEKRMAPVGTQLMSFNYTTIQFLIKLHYIHILIHLQPNYKYIVQVQKGHGYPSLD